MKIQKNSKLKVAHASLVPAQLGSAHGFDGLASGPNLPRPLLSCAPQLLLEISTGSHLRRLRLDPPCRHDTPVPLPFIPLHHQPHPYPHGPQGRWGRSQAPGQRPRGGLGFMR
jgi:hypothetical protein